MEKKLYLLIYTDFLFHKCSSGRVFDTLEAAQDAMKKQFWEEMGSRGFTAISDACIANYKCAIYDMHASIYNWKKRDDAEWVIQERGLNED